jgi:hypothetical protein
VIIEVLLLEAVPLRLFPRIATYFKTNIHKHTADLVAEYTGAIAKGNRALIDDTLTMILVSIGASLKYLIAKYVPRTTEVKLISISRSL